MEDPVAAGKRDGMGRAERHVNPHWWQCMLEAGHIVAQRRPWFSCDDVVELCDKLHPNAFTHERRAVGPLMTALAKLGYCEAMQFVGRTRQPQSHGGARILWWSLIYTGPTIRKKPRRHRPFDPRQLEMLLPFSLTPLTSDIAAK